MVKSAIDLRKLNRKPKSEKRNVRIEFNLSFEEQELIRAKANLLHLSIASFIRLKLFST